jgi:hypothetical protein
LFLEGRTTEEDEEPDRNNPEGFCSCKPAANSKNAVDRSEDQTTNHPAKMLFWLRQKHLS